VDSRALFPVATCSEFRLLALEAGLKASDDADQEVCDVQKSSRFEHLELL